MVIQKIAFALALLALTAGAVAPPNATYADVRNALLATHHFALTTNERRYAMQTELRLGGCAGSEGKAFLSPMRSSSIASPQWNADVRLLAYADIAYEALTVEQQLPQGGYPRSVWSRALTLFETREVALAENSRLSPEALAPDRRAFRAALSATLESYHKKHRAAAKVSFPDIECGPPGARMVRLETQPSGGTVFVIPTFFYQLCKIKRTDPNDLNACAQWRESLQGIVTYVAGDYYYLVRWKDGSQKRGKLSFEDMHNLQRVVLHK